jgi:hydroxymethylglutaryl-CoA synthase
VRGIVSFGAYLPHRRLDRQTIAAVAGAGGGTGTRTVASYDEDTTTMGVEAGRLALRAAPGVPVEDLWFATTSPAYADRTNATTIHAALRLDRSATAADANGAIRSGVSCLRAALEGRRTTLVVASDVRTGLPGSADEAAGGDGAAAVVVADGDRVAAELIGAGSATEEFLDRWRAPGEVRTRVWEERFGEGRYAACGEDAWTAALKDAGVETVDHLVVAGTHARAAAALAKRLAGPATTVADTLSATVGHTGAAHPLLLLGSVLETSGPGRTVALVSLADGADVLVFRTHRALASGRPLAAQVAAGGPIGYGKFLAWKGMLPVEPPRRPEPSRVSASAAARSGPWKFGFVGSRDAATDEIRLPPAVPGADPGAVLEPAPMSDAQATVVTYTVDRLAYSPSPPVVFAVVDFDGGGRLPVELTDVDADAVRIGQRVEPTFRRLSTADGIHNYFWKARPI